MRTSLFALVTVVLAVPASLSAGPRPDTAPELHGTGWVNTAREFSMDRLRGKAVFLYFYEEG